VRGWRGLFCQIRKGGRFAWARCGRTGRRSLHFFGTTGEFSAGSISRSCAITSRRFWTRERGWRPSGWAICGTRKLFALRRASVFRSWLTSSEKPIARRDCAVGRSCICYAATTRLRASEHARRDTVNIGWGGIRSNWAGALCLGRAMRICTYTSARRSGTTRRWGICWRRSRGSKARRLGRRAAFFLWLANNSRARVRGRGALGTAGKVPALWWGARASGTPVLHLQ